MFHNRLSYVYTTKRLDLKRSGLINIIDQLQELTAKQLIYAEKWNLRHQ